MKKILFIVCALCATLVNAQTDMTAQQLKAAMAGKVYFNNDLDNPLGVIAQEQANCFWGTNDMGFGPFLDDCNSIKDEGNGKYATTYGDDLFNGLAVTFTVKNNVVTRFEVTSACDGIPEGIYTPFNPGTLSNKCEDGVLVYLGVNTFINFWPGTTTIAENLENFDGFFMSKASMESDRIYVPDGLTFSEYNVYGYEELDFDERMDLEERTGKRFGVKLVECTEATFIPSKPGPDLDPDAEYVVVTYKEGSDTKTAYYKASDVEKIEWLKGEDITE